MKLFEIIESKDMQEAVDKIKVDCEPFILEGAPLLYRGMGFNSSSIKQVNSLLYTVNVRKDRQPKDSSLWLHNLLNEFFKKHTGINARSESVFCSGSKTSAEPYGDKICAIFPISDFQYTWSDKIRDAYDVFEEEWYQAPGLAVNKALKKAADSLGISRDDMEMPDDIQRHNIIKKFLEDDGETFYHFSKNLEEAAKSGKEIMLACDKYYAVNITDFKFIDDLIEKIKA